MISTAGFGPLRLEPSLPPSRRAGSRERRRLRTLAAAEELFALQGFAKTTVDEIARRAGVSKGLVYDRYDSKEQLLRAALDLIVEGLRAPRACGPSREDAP